MITEEEKEKGRAMLRDMDKVSNGFLAMIESFESEEIKQEFQKAWGQFVQEFKEAKAMIVVEYELI